MNFCLKQSSLFSFYALRGGPLLSASKLMTLENKKERWMPLLIGNNTLSILKYKFQL